MATHRSRRCRHQVPRLRAHKSKGSVVTSLENAIVGSLGARRGRRPPCLRDDDEALESDSRATPPGGHDRSARVRVERAPSLVGEDHARAAHEGAGDAMRCCSPPLISPGASRRDPPGPRVQACQGQLSACCDCAPEAYRRAPRRFGGRTGGEDVNCWKTKPEVLAAHARRPSPRRVVSPSARRCLTWSVQQANDVEHRQFAGTGGPRWTCSPAATSR